MNDQPQNQQNNIPEESLPEISKKQRRELRREERRAAQTSVKQTHSLRKILIWAIAFLAVGGSVAGVYYAATTSTPDDTNQNGTLRNTVSSTDWIRGNSASSVTFVEYGDFQCPACAEYHPLVKMLEQEFASDVQFVFRHFPLTRPHPNAKAAAAAAEAAGMQGKFWEMHDILFERQNEWAPKPRPQSAFVGYAEELGLDIAKFEEDMDRDDVEEKIDGHFENGSASGVNATPTFFLNGKKLESPRSYDEFSTLLAEAVAAAKSTSVAASTTPET